MPVLTKRNEAVIALTYKCNWNCNYCPVRNKHDYKEQVSYRENLSKIARVKDHWNVTLTGGEPGLLDKAQLEEYISLLQEKRCKIYLETNGLFLKRYPELVPQFESILHHCSQDLDVANDVILCPDAKNIRRLLVVNDENFPKLEHFLNEYSAYKFDVIEATYPYKDNVGPTLAKTSKYSLLRKFSKHMTKESIKRMLSGKDFESIEWYM